MPKANDLFNQYIRSMNLSLSDRQKRLEEMCNCHHVFFLLKADDYGDTIECLKCGLTNKFLGLRWRFINADADIVENIAFEELSCKMGTYNIINHRALNTYHPRELYQACKEINLSFDLDDPTCYDQLFDMMDDLSHEETPQESYAITTYEDCSDLIARYRKRTGKEYKKVIK